MDLEALLARLHQRSPRDFQQEYQGESVLRGKPPITNYCWKAPDPNVIDAVAVVDRTNENQPCPLSLPSPAGKKD